MRFYKCINCGYMGDFKITLMTNKSRCQICRYDDLIEYSEEEYAKWASKYKQKQDKNPFYVSRCKKNPFGQELKGPEIVKGSK